MVLSGLTDLLSTKNGFESRKEIHELKSAEQAVKEMEVGGNEK